MELVGSVRACKRVGDELILNIFCYLLSIRMEWKCYRMIGLILNSYVYLDKWGVVRMSYLIGSLDFFFEDFVLI